VTFRYFNARYGVLTRHHLCGLIGGQNVGFMSSSICRRAKVECFLTSLKAELVWLRNQQTRQKVKVARFEYIYGFYNPRRKHSALSRKSPVAFEKKAA
jgi:putative transposase